MNIGRNTSDFEVRDLRSDEYAMWDSMVEQSPEGTPFHKTSWLKSFEGYKCTIVVCIHNGSIVCGVPLTYTQRYGFKFAVNPPFTPYLGILFKPTDQKYTRRMAYEKKLAKLIAERMHGFAPYIEYSFHYSFVDAQPFIWAGFSAKPHYTYVLNLKDPVDIILRNMKKETRNRISTSLKHSLKFSDATADELIELIHIAYSRKNQKMPYSRRALQEDLRVFFKNQTMKAIVAKEKGELLAGGAIVYDSRRAHYLIGGVNQICSYPGVGSLVIWNLIKYAKETLSLSEFDFEGSMNPNIEQFFRGFGGKLTPYYTIYKANLMHSLTSFILERKIKSPV